MPLVNDISFPDRVCGQPLKREKGDLDVIRVTLEIFDTSVDYESSK